MEANQLLNMRLVKIAELLRSGELSPNDLVHAAQQRIEDTEDSIHAYTTLAFEMAREDAAEAEEEFQRGNYKGILHGIPVSVKDLIDTEDIRTTYGSQIFSDHVPDEDAEVVRRLRVAGAIILGKTNTHEFALGGITPPTRNPNDEERIPGGSSGGSAAAIAAGSAFSTLGSDTGGSIRIPASYCGVVGLKPTYDLVSRKGVFPEAWSLDHIGPITRYVEDCAVVLETIAGGETRDSNTSSESPDGYLRKIGDSIEDVRIGVPENHFYDRLQSDVESAVANAHRTLASLGAHLAAIQLPNIDEVISAFTAIDLAEIGANHRRLYREHASEYQKDTKQFAEWGFFVGGVDYVDAQRARPRLVRRLLDAMETVDMLVVPSQPITAPKIGETTEAVIGTETEDLLWSMVRFLAPFNFAGFPALSLCCGFDSDGLPIGLQIVGKPHCEAEVFKVAHAFEQSTRLYEELPCFQ